MALQESKPGVSQIPPPLFFLCFCSHLLVAFCGGYMYEYPANTSVLGEGGTVGTSDLWSRIYFSININIIYALPESSVPDSSLIQA